MSTPVSTLLPNALLQPHEPSPVTAINLAGGSTVFLTCEHAGHRIPERLGDLGVSETERRRHIAWDIGIEDVSRQVSKNLDAPLVLQTYSRLVIDCNRKTTVPDSIPVKSEDTPIPGNHDLSEADRRARADEVYWPYHQTITEALDARARAGQPTVVIAMHSFTPRYRGVDRPWHLGLLYNRDRRVADALRTPLADHGDLVVGDNEPYAIGDESDYTIPVHGEQRGLLHLEFEVRQDLISHDAGVTEWADRLTHLLHHGLTALRGHGHL